MNHERNNRQEVGRTLSPWIMAALNSMNLQEVKARVNNCKDEAPKRQEKKQISKFTK